jgi:hypothetical protein
MEEIALESLKKQLDGIESKLNAILENTTPCEEKKRNGEASVAAVLQLFEQSPIAKNPMVAEMLKPMKDMLAAQRG